MTDPRAQLAMAEVHDCFTPTELVLMEDLGFAERGTAWKEVLEGTFELDGELPVNPGTAASRVSGTPIGASACVASLLRVLAAACAARRRPSARSRRSGRGAPSG